MRCIISARYVMTADILRLGDGIEPANLISEAGSWVRVQDPITHEIVREWVPVYDDTDPLAFKTHSVDCMVNGIVDGGIRVAGTTERFGKEYDNVDFVKMFFAPNIIITKQDRITNVRSKRTGTIVWKEEERDEVDGQYRATIFNVMGVTPIVDPLTGRHIENTALLARAE